MILWTATARATVVLLSDDPQQRVSQLAIALSDPTTTNTGITALPYNNYINLTGASTSASIAGNLTADAFRLTFSQARSAGVTGYGQSQFLVYLSVTEPTTYALSGRFAVTNDAGKSSALSYGIDIYDANTSGTSTQYLYHEVQYSAKTPNASFDLGGALTGDGMATRTANSFVLLPSHVYAINATFFLGESGFSFPITAATATGNMTITFTAPEPGGVLGYAGLAGTLLLRVRRRRAAALGAV